MKHVNPWYLHKLLGPLAGRADDPEEVRKYLYLDPNDEAEVKVIIREFLKPYYIRFDAVSKKVVRDTLGYCLSKGEFRLDRVFHSSLIPFEAPVDPRQFFVWVWEELFSPDDYQTQDWSECELTTGINEIYNIRLEPEPPA